MTASLRMPVVVGDPFLAWFAPRDVPTALEGTLRFCGDGFVKATGPGVFGILGRIGIVLPRCLRDAPHQAARLKGTGSLIRVLAKYWHDDRSQRSIGRALLEPAVESAGDPDDLIAALEASLALVADYHESGPVLMATRETSPRVRGRTHWPRTLATVRPIVSGFDVVFPDPVNVKQTTNTDHPFTRLHRLTCEAAAAWMGIGGATAAPAPDSRTALAVLDRVEHELFQDRHRRVCRLLRRYYHPDVAGAGRQRLRTTGLFASDFSRVWEAMLRSALQPAEDVCFPVGQYRLEQSGAGKPPTGAHLIPDIVLQADVGGRAYLLIVDAKDYDFRLASDTAGQGGSGALPATESLTKQFLYRHFLSDRYTPGSGSPLDRIGSAFVLPGSLSEGAALRLLAIHDLAGEENASWPFGRVVCLAMDFDTVADAYAKGRPAAGARAGLASLVVREMSREVPTGSFGSPGFGTPVALTV